jgi:hypothetical protein
MQGCKGNYTKVIAIWQFSIVPLSNLVNANCTNEQYGIHSRISKTKIQTKGLVNNTREWIIAHMAFNFVLLASISTFLKALSILHKLGKSYYQCKSMNPMNKSLQVFQHIQLFLQNTKLGPKGKHKT